jgi:predicted transcriptional regulator
MATATKTAADKTLKINEQKWTKPLMDAGWICMPSVIIERQAALGLDAIDINILMHLAMYWWTEDSKPHPSKVTIAAALGIEPRSVQRRIAKLEAAGLVHREERRSGPTGSLTNRYHFDGLIKEATPFAMERNEEIEAKKAATLARAARKGRPTLKVVASTDE